MSYIVDVENQPREFIPSEQNDLTSLQLARDVLRDIRRRKLLALETKIGSIVYATSLALDAYEYLLDEATEKINET
jgi:hypothetical protein